MNATDPAPSSLKVSAEQYADCCLVAVSGRVDHTNSDDFLKDLTAHAEKVARGGGMVIDLGKLDFITSAGLRALLLAQRAVTTGDGKLVVCGIGGVVREVFRISKFDALLNVSSSTEEAMAQISAEAAEAFSG
ncbi:MAG: STAS domain-containing protein [Pseudomonadota bacterium]